MVEALVACVDRLLPRSVVACPRLRLLNCRRFSLLFSFLIVVFNVVHCPSVVLDAELETCDLSVSLIAG